MFTMKSKSAAIATVGVLVFALLLSAAPGLGPAPASSATLYGFVVKSIESLRTLAAVFRLATGSGLTATPEPASQFQPKSSVPEEDILQCSGESVPAPKPTSQS